MTDESSHEPALPKDKGGRPKAETIALVLVPHQFDAAGRRGHLFQLCEIALRKDHEGDAPLVARSYFIRVSKSVPT